MTERWRAFVAVWPPPAVGRALAALARPERPGLRWTTPDQWHVTLRFLGRVDPGRVTEAFAGLEPPGPAQAVLGPTVGRFGDRVLHVPVAGLDALAAAVAAVPGLGPRPERSFRGHVTLARARGSAAVDLGALTGAPVAGRWPVGEVTLVRSHLDGAGARYEVVARRPLPPAG